MLKAIWLSIRTPGRESEEPFTQRELPKDTADITQSCAVRKRGASSPVGGGEEDKQMQRMPKRRKKNALIDSDTTSPGVVEGRGTPVEETAQGERVVDDNIDQASNSYHRKQATALVPLSIARGNHPTDVEKSVDNQRKASFEVEGSRLPVNGLEVRPTSKTSKTKPPPLPGWVYPDWTQTFLPTLTHALFVSKNPFQDFKSSSPVFLTTFQDIFKLVYPNVLYDANVADVLIAEAAQRLTTKRSKISSAVLEEVRNFFKHEQYLNHPNEIQRYVKWALRPDGPAFQEIPTPITCQVDRSHKDHVPPKGTFQSPFINRVAAQFLLHVKDSILEPSISASNPPMGLYGLLLVSVERAFMSFNSGSYKKPKAKFCQEGYGSELKTYLLHLDAVSPQLWKQILGRVDAADLGRAKEDKLVHADIRTNLYICEP